MAKAKSQSSKRGKLDIATVAGLAVAGCGILGGLLLEGGRLTDITQVTAAMIVLGGTIGAVMVTTPMPLLKAAVKKMPSIIWLPTTSPSGIIAEIVSLATQARKMGLISLDDHVDEISDPFLKKALMLVIDGTDFKVARGIMELEMQSAEEQGEAEAKVLEAAGGYAPTVGIIGAILGLIQVMKHLEQMESVGHGIAVAFVATVYGVAVANLVFLPAASKLKSRLRGEVKLKELILEGVAGIAEGLNPRLIEKRLEAYAPPLPGATDKLSKSGKGKSRIATAA